MKDGNVGVDEVDEGNRRRHNHRVKGVKVRIEYSDSNMVDNVGLREGLGVRRFVLWLQDK